MLNPRTIGYRGSFQWHKVCSFMFRIPGRSSTRKVLTIPTVRLMYFFIYCPFYWPIPTEVSGLIDERWILTFRFSNTFTLNGTHQLLAYADDVNILGGKRTYDKGKCRSWSRVLLEKLTGSAASQEIPHIFGTRRFITVPTSSRHLSLYIHTLIKLMYVCMYVCTYVCMYVCMCVYVYVYMYVCLCMCVLCMYICMYVSPRCK